MVVLFTGYTFLAGYSPSVVRAVAMVLLHAFAKMTGRRYDLPCAAFAVGIIALARNPYILLQAGFQMSFLAVLTLGLITPYVHRVYSGALAGSIAIQVGLGPYMMYQFNILPLGAVLINVPVIFLAGLLVPAGMVGMFLPGGAAESVNGSGAAVAAAAAQAGPAQTEAAASGDLIPGQFIAGVWDQGVASLCGAMIRLNELCSASRITSLDVASPPIWALGIFYLGLLAFASEEGRLMIMRRRRRLIKSLVIGVLVSSIAFGQVVDDGFRRADLVFVDVGQGDCMHLRIKSWTGQVRYNVLIDGGGKADFDLGKKTLKPYLLKNGARRIDLAIVTHLHTDHYDGIRSLARMGMVKKICVYEGYRPQEQEILKECGLAREDLIYVTAGDEIRLGSARFDFLAPPARSDEEYAQMAADEEDENKKSLLIKVAICGVSAMMTGDIDEDGERDAMGAAGMAGAEDGQQGKAGAEHGQQGAAGSRSDKAAPQGDQDPQPAPSLHCDILKVGHHGSKTSSCEEFLDAVGPAFAVIQVGKNNMYGHPTPEVLQRLAIRQIPVYRNDLQGAVGMEIKGGRVKKVRTMLGDQ